MRAFIAISLPPSAKDSLATIQKKLQAYKADVRWVEPKNIHLTLRFLGEITDDMARSITTILDENAKGIAPYPISLSSLGAFPTISAARVIWIGLNKGAQETTYLANLVEKQLSALGIPEAEKPFSAHITLGRLRSPAGSNKLKEALQNKITLSGNIEFQVGCITLFKSTLTPTGPVYEIVSSASLATI
ncbi:MAG: RNA 2',3'-cyclic phosphodiesterase [Candidatus Omnitrophica bacterium]|nr:RNA 2',3'-cyclic phosphodiesterase [Candidatus Omnitrophota bacterium]